MSTNMKRRLFLKGSIAASAMLSAVSLIPARVLAAWPKDAFAAREMEVSMKSLFGDAEPEESAEVKVKVPEIAENGAVVPVTVSTDIEGVESITIFAENNPIPLVANFVLGTGALAFASARIKMGKTGDVIGVVKAGGRLYKGSKTVKVTIGGCGG